MTATASASPVSGNAFLYSKPEALSVDLHGALGIDPAERPYGFVGRTNMVPLMVTEFAPAALSYPVVFVGEARQPVAVMALRDGENLFVSGDGEFRPEAYIPAYIRRYPFVFASDEAQKRMILCVDRAAPFLRDGGASPLFVEGKPSPYTQQALEFCNSFEQERRRTGAFLSVLQDMDLLEVRETVFTPRNPDGAKAAPQKIAEYYAVSEDKLRALPIEQLAALRDNGALGQIYAHLLSLQGWDRLITIMSAGAAQPDARKGGKRSKSAKAVG